MEPSSNKPPRTKGSPSSALHFMDIAFRMGGIIALGALGGKWLDGYFHTSKPYFTLSLSLFAVFGAIFMVIRAASQNKT
jgi:ATP synthase protein I